tara:strand:+ start:94 stop:258 length:165 start_codon:yes stop_codon:yes gene_type:complete
MVVSIEERRKEQEMCVICLLQGDSPIRIFNNQEKRMADNREAVIWLRISNGGNV